ncbi:MAG: dockerin type I repeat-containing protein [Planctomycetota bacterium]
MVRACIPTLAVCLVSAVVLFTSDVAAQTFEFKAPTTTFAVDPNDPGGTVVLGFTIEQTSGSPAGTQGFSMGVAHDPTVLNTVAVDYGEGVLEDPWGQPDFFSRAEYSDGWTCGVVYSAYGGWLIEFSEPRVAIDVTYEIVSDVPVESPITTDFAWVDTLGMPPVSNVVVVGGASIYADSVDGEFTCVPVSFIRGDMNSDGGINIADIFTAEDYLFLDGDTPSCLAALDANGDGAIDIGDIIYELSYLFLGGEPMPAPFPACGPLSVGSEVSCEESQCVP